MAISNGYRYSEPQQSYEDDICAVSPSSEFFTTTTKGLYVSTDLTCNSPSTRQVFSGIRTGARILKL
ncbi:hypothetical protein TNCV_558911 [Trichonephila clavipes]|nr:hypothetical protein TNCV_558911 [Trichonephila clavipes]